MGRDLLVKALPQRIVSLVPSQTELLFDLGLGDRVVGITKFCIHPKSWFQQKVRVGGTKKVNLDKVIALQPDLVIGNKEENTQSDIEALTEAFPVWMSDISDLTQALDMITQVGLITGTQEKAKELAASIKNGFEALASGGKPKRALYLIWNDPYMVAGQDTFINSMLKYVSLENAILESRYPVLEASQIAVIDPEVILLSSEPYPFSEKHIEALRLICPKAEIQLVDGEMFSWYGSRLLHSLEYFNLFKDNLHLKNL
jgi:ABC-type Fe3+-hydroxamate transport system substrate-binding protein